MKTTEVSNTGSFNLSALLFEDWRTSIDASAETWEDEEDDLNDLKSITLAEARETLTRSHAETERNLYILYLRNKMSH